MDRKWIKERVKAGEYLLCVAAELERQAEKISLDVLEKALLEGKIARKFPSDPRGTTFLVERRGKKVMHVLCAASGKNALRILAIYHPSHPKWFFPKPNKP